MFKNIITHFSSWYNKLIAFLSPRPITKSAVIEIPLTQDKMALIDADDFQSIGQYRWRALRINGHWYAVRSEGKNTIYMHRQILSSTTHLRGMHKSNNCLDNRRANLILCTQSQVKFANKRSANNTSGFRGVSWHQHRNKFRARIKVHRALIHLGYFRSPNDAAKAYDDAAKKYFGAFARLNFPEPNKAM